MLERVGKKKLKEAWLLHRANKLGTSIRKRLRRLAWSRSVAQEREPIRTRQGIFFTDPLDQGVSEQLRRHGEYELDDLHRIQNLISSRCRVLVVGAHIGAFAVPVSRVCAELTAIEANPRSYALLERNLQANDCSNVRSHNIAAGEKVGDIDFVFNTANSGGAKRMPKHKDAAYFFDGPDVGKLPTTRLDDYLAGQEYDVVLMDIEGSEYFALLGMQRILSRARLLIVEFLPQHLERVAGITVADFLEPILPHFDQLTIPSAGRTVERGRMLPELQRRFQQGKGDLGLVFAKRSSPQ